MSQEWKDWYKQRGWCAGKSAHESPCCDVERTKVAKMRTGCREKPLLCHMCPYRKPTQVDEERILRPTEEVLLRNSAK